MKLLHLLNFRKSYIFEVNEVSEVLALRVAPEHQRSARTSETWYLFSQLWERGRPRPHLRRLRARTPAFPALTLQRYYIKLTFCLFVAILFGWQIDSYERVV